MRLMPIALSVALAVATIGSAGQGQLADDQVNPFSVSLVQQAEGLTAAGQLQEAADLLESALAVDPRNRAAYIAMARVAQKQKLPGKAIALYGKALKLEPNDVNALAGQGEALVERGALERAKANLQKIKEACKTNCPQAVTLAAMIAKGPPPEVKTAQAPTTPVPTPEKN